MNFRTLKPNEIDVKIGTVGKSGFTLLLYKNARVDMAILDETVGAEHWQNKFYEVVGNLYCSLGININYNKDKEPLWVWKDDCGVESAFGDKEKGQASDARKRAGFAWGIGRELYTSPFIFMACKTEWKEDKKCYKIADKDLEKLIPNFVVSKIEYSPDREITALELINKKDGEIVYSYKEKTQEKEIKETKTEQSCDCIYECQNCGVQITEKVAKYSKAKFGQELCYDCQKKLNNKPQEVEL